MLLNASTNWKITFPGSCIGILGLRDVLNPTTHHELSLQRDKLETRLRKTYAGMDRAALKSHPTLSVFASYYKRFKKTYHVQLQLESIAFKGKSIPNVAALVEAMFMAELKNLLLTAGHDLDAIQGTPTTDVANGDETYIKINGQEQTLKAGDMYIRDHEGVLSSIIYGPAQRASIHHATTSALFTVYGPQGIDESQMRAHLEDIQSYVSLFSPEARLIQLDVLSSNNS